MSAVLYIDRHGTKIGVAQGRLTLKALDQAEQTLPSHQIDQVIVLAHVHFSHDAIAMLLREDIPVIFSALRGGYRGTLSGRPGRQIMRRKQQFKAMDDPFQQLTLARALVQAKLRGHGRLLRQWKLAGRHEIAAGLLASHRCPNLDSLRGYEGAAARAFFDGLRHHLEGSLFQFEQRCQHPPPDPVNSLLSLVYTLLMNEVEVGVSAAGLDAAGGFYHVAADGRPTLLISGMITWRGEHTSWRRIIHLQARELAHWLDGRIPAPRFWHLDDV